MLPRTLRALASLVAIGLSGATLSACSSTPPPPTPTASPAVCPAAPAAYKSMVSQFLAGVDSGNAAEVNSLSFTGITFTGSGGQTLSYYRPGDPKTGAAFADLKSAVTALGVAAGDVTKVIALDDANHGGQLEPQHVYVKSGSGKVIVFVFGYGSEGPELNGFGTADAPTLASYHCTNL